MKTYFEKVPMFTYEIFTRVVNADDFVTLLVDMDTGTSEVYCPEALEAFKDEFGFEAGYLIDMAKACKAFDFESALRVLYAQSWADVKRLPEFATLPADIRHQIAKFDTIHTACCNYNINDAEAFDLAFLDWAEDADADMDCVDYPDFIACAYLALMTQC